MIQSHPTIACHINGIRRHQEVSIPTGALKDIEKAVSAARILLSAFGGYGMDEIPQFCDDILLLAVATPGPGAQPFDAGRFDLFVRCIADLINSRNAGGSSTLIHQHHGVDTEVAHQAARSLKDLGTVILGIDGMEMIKLANRRNWQEERGERYVSMEVASTEEVARLTCYKKEAIASDEQAKNLHPGDSIRLDQATDGTTVHREIGSLVRVESTDAVTIDMFDPDDSGD